MTKVVKIEELEFVQLILEEEIKEKTAQIGAQITKDYQGQNPLFLIVLNGAFIFAADLLRKIDLDCDIRFVEAKSYKGLESTGEVLIKNDLSFVQNRNVVIIEDIVDSGNTIVELSQICRNEGVQSLKIASLLSKPSATIHDITVDYVCFEISKLFVIGYGLDYNGKGRNLPDIYQIRPFVK